MTVNNYKETSPGWIHTARKIATDSGEVEWRYSEDEALECTVLYPAMVAHETVDNSNSTKPLTSSCQQCFWVAEQSTAPQRT